MKLRGITFRLTAVERRRRRTGASVAGSISERLSVVFGKDRVARM